MKKINKVLLLTPPAFTFKDAIDISPLPPMGLGYLAAVLRNKGLDVRIIDSLIEGWEEREEINDKEIRVGLHFSKIKEIIEEYNPDLIGINMLFTKQRSNAHKIFEIAKLVNPKIITVGGGAHATILPEDVLSDKNVDFVVMGEGENTISDLIEVIDGHKNIDALDGIAYKHNNDIKIVPKIKFITNLDEIPFPAWDLMKLEKYYGLEATHGKRKRKKFAPIITSRGCPARCVFCSAYKVWGRRYRQRSVENVLAEMKILKERYGIEELLFEDDNVTLNKVRAKEIFMGMIENKFNFVWDTPNGVAAYALDNELINLMKNSGCHKMNLAIESGNQEVLNKIIKKPVKLEKVRELILYAKKIKLDVGLYLIIGMPGEKIEQMRDTFKIAADLDIFDPHVSVATPYPGSELYDACVKNGYMGQQFTLDDLYIRSFSINTEDWTGEQIREVFKNGFKYLRCAYIKRHPIRKILYYFQVFIRHPFKSIIKIDSLIKNVMGAIKT